MNEQILELAKQAGLKFPSETAVSPSELKFAQLIAQECANIDFRAKIGLSHESDYEVSRVIREHFGVEE